MPKLPFSPLLLSLGLFAAPAMAQPAPVAPLPAPAAPAPPAAPPAADSTLPPAPVTDAPKVDAPPPVVEPAKPAQLETTQPKDGFGFASSDGAFALKIKGLAQADGRFFFAGGGNQFLLRRVRPTLEGTIYRYFDFRITAELAGAATALDVWANVRPLKELQFRAGKFKSPIGLERLQNDPEMPFIERGLPTDLVPDRDVGAMVHGEIGDGTLAYAVAVFNGAEDNKNIDTDSSDKKDVVGRIFLRPLVPLKIDALKNFGLGFAASRGTHTDPLPNYVSPSQVSFFSYNATAAEVGTHRRIAPQAYFYIGPVGILGEYTRSTQMIASATKAPTAINNDAWQVELSGYITGENASFAMVSPKSPLDPAKGGFGAIELAVRMGALKIDDAAFDLGFADIKKSARSAKEWAVGLNWHMVRGYKLDFNYEHTTYEGGIAGGDRPTETALLTRMQAIF